MRARAQEYDRLRQEERDTLDAMLAQEAEESRAAEATRAARRRSMQQSMRAQAEAAASRAARCTRPSVPKRKENGTQEDGGVEQTEEEDDAELWHAASEAEWAKKEARWNAETAARDALLRSVLIARREQVMEKRAARARARSTERREHAEWVGALDATRGTLDAAERARRMAMLAETQRCLDTQVAARRAQRASEQERNRLVNDYDCNDKEREAQLAEAMAELEAAKPEEFRHVPLVPRERRSHLR